MRNYLLKVLSLFWLSTIFLSCNKEKVEEVDVNWKIGSNSYSIEVEGVERKYLVYVPTGYKEEESVPVLFMMHGASGTGGKFYNISGWVEKAEKENFIAVFPTAIAYLIEERGEFVTRWSVDNLKELVAENTKIQDDVIFFDAMVNELQHTFNVDERKMYACGFSNGGSFVRNQLMARRSNVFAAFAAVGGYRVEENLVIEGERIPSLFTIIGSKDPMLIADINDFNEVPLDANEFLKIPYFDSTLDNLLEVLALEKDYSESPNPPAYNKLAFLNSKSNIENEFNLMIVKDLEHVFPVANNNKQKVIATDIIWPWFTKFTLN